MAGSGRIRNVSRAVSLGWHDVTSLSYRADNSGFRDATDAIMAAIEAAGQSGGGIVYFPTGRYKLRLKTISTNINTYRICALAVQYDNVFLVGDSDGVSELFLEEGGIYGAIQFLQLPLQNGVPKLNNSGFRNLKIDGSYDRSSGSFSVGYPLVYAVGTIDCEFDNFWLLNSSHYAIGAQNGGHIRLRVTNGFIEKTGQDGIDAKNNTDDTDTSQNIGLVFDNLAFSKCGRGSAPSTPFACLDVDGIGTTISNITIIDFPEDAGATVEAGVRAKQGRDDDSLNRGNGGMRVNMVNVRVNKQAAATTGDVGIAINAAWVSATNCHVTGAFSAGMRMRQPAMITGSSVDGATIGFDVLTISGTADAWVYSTGGQYGTLSSVSATNCGTGIKTTRADTAIIAPFLDTCTLGIDCALSSYSGVIFHARYKDCGTNLQINGVAQTDVETLLIKDGTPLRVGRNSKQYLDFKLTSAANAFNSYSDPANAKSLYTNITTDESDTTPSGGSVGWAVEVLNVPVFNIDQNANFAVGRGATLAAGATDGFFYAPKIANTPSGVPTAKTGMSPMIVDETNNRLWVNINGTWKYAALS